VLRNGGGNLLGSHAFVYSRAVATFQNAFITGASAGIGRSLASQIAARGTRVVLAARRQAELETLAGEILASGGRADVCPLDVANSTATREAIQHWDREVGGLDLVIANAGVGVARPAHKLEWTDIEPVLQVNVIGAFATIHAAVQQMLPRGRGTIVGVSSLASMRGLPGSGAYAASKAALATFLETLRADLRRKGLVVVDVRPGFVDTAMTKPNKFKMPFLMSADEAAKAALRGIDRGDAIVAFPWPTASVMSLAESLPDPIWRTLASTIKM